MENLFLSNFYLRIHQYSDHPYKLFKISGEDRADYCQRYFTNDIKSISPNQSQYNCRLDFSGRIQSFLCLLNTGDHFIALIEEPMVAGFINDFNKYIITEDVELQIIDDSFQMLIGADSWELDSGYKFFLNSIPTNFISQKRSNQYPEISKNDFEILKILSGIPRYGIDFDQNTIVNNTFLNEVAVSYKKGCFLGQETVAKIESRRGAANYPVYLLGENKVSSNDDIYIGEVKCGKVLGRIELGEQKIIYASIAREWRVHDSNHNFKINGIEFKAKVKQLPYFNVFSFKDYIQFLFQLGSDLYIKNENHLEAIEVFKRCVLLDPSFEDAYEALAVVLAKSENYNEAIDVMNKLVSINPNCIMAHTNLSLYYMKKGDIQKAEDEKAMATVLSFEMNGNEFELKELEKTKMVEEEKSRNAREKMFLQVLEIDDEDSMANFGLGEIYFDRSQYTLAINFLEKTIRSETSHGKAFLKLGLAYKLSGNEKMAASIFERGILESAKKGDLRTANEIQMRLNELNS